MRLNFRLPDTIEECENNQIQITCYDSIDESQIKANIYSEICNENSLERSNLFWKKLVDTEAFQNVAQRINGIEITRLDLDDWGPLLTTLKQSGANIEKLELHDCHFTEKGALLLGNVLKTVSSNNNKNHLDIQNKEVTTTVDTTSRRSGVIEIKKLKISSLYGSMAWIDGFLQNKTVTHLSLEYIPILHNAVQFIQNSPQIKRAEIQFLKSEEGFNIYLDTLNRDESMDLEILVISFDEQFPLSLCQRIGRILRRAKNLERLTLMRFRSDIPYNFLQDAIHCQNIGLLHSDFDPVALYFLIHGNADNGATTTGGKLKEVYISGVKDASKVEHLLRLVDLSLLDSFSIYWCQFFGSQQRCDGLLDSLCHQFAENKGPKYLQIYIDHAGPNEIASRLAPGLIGNDKIEELRIGGNEDFENAEPLKDLFNAMGHMPRLRSWKLNDGYGCIFCLREQAEKWKEWILPQVQSNPSIQDIGVPFDLGSDIKEILVFNKHWRKFLCCHDQMSSGIWSPALGQIETVDLMYRVVREVPSLFQYYVANAANALEKNRLPSFVVPHHIDCPGCCKRRKERAHA